MSYLNCYLDDESYTEEKIIKANCRFFIRTGKLPGEFHYMAVFYGKAKKASMVKTYKILDYLLEDKERYINYFKRLFDKEKARKEKEKEQKKIQGEKLLNSLKVGDFYFGRLGVNNDHYKFYQIISKDKKNRPTLEKFGEKYTRLREFAVGVKIDIQKKERELFKGSAKGNNLLIRDNNERVYLHKVEDLDEVFIEYNYS